MLKKINILLFYIVFSLSLSAKEPLLATLTLTLSNETQRFGIGNYTFECKPYGVLTLEKLYRESKKDSLCQKSIDKFYIKNPKLKYFADRILKLEQKYHVEIKEAECIVYAKGQVTFSELLLKKGLAIKKPLFRDEEFNNCFTLAQKKAKIEKKGLWGEKIFNNCVEELYK